MTSFADGSLSGLRVIDLTRVLGGPYCTQILGDHGADIIKIEPPAGDEVRDWGPPFHDGSASYFIGVNRNKRSLGLDLSRPEGRDVLLRLLEDADVLIENYKTGTMERWGLGYKEALSVRFPRLIHCRISGFGADGPMGGYAGYDAVVQAMVGMFSINGSAQSEPTRIGVPMVDIGTGLYSAIAILMAVVERQRSGQGQFVDATLWDCAMALMHPFTANYFLSGKPPVRTGNAHPNVSPYDRYRTATVDIFLAVGNNRAFQRLCAEIGAPGLAEDPRFRDNGDRVTNRADLTKELESVLVKLDGKALAEQLLKAGVPAGPVLDVAQATGHVHAAHRGNVVEKDGYRGIATPIRLSRSRSRVSRLPPRFGADGPAILAECGFSEKDISALRAAGVLVTERR